MTYTLIFELIDNENGTIERLDEWKRESVIPRMGDSVLMQKCGWKTVSHVSFSIKDKTNRFVYLTVK